MSFYRRKSLKAGPFRFTASKSGFNVSVGIPGLRIGSGSRGNYVSIGRNGAVYRTTIPQEQTKSPKLPQNEEPIPPETSSVVLEEIESADILQLQDSSAVELLNEMNSKHQKRHLWPFVLGLSIVVAYVLLNLNSPDWVYLVLILISGIAFLFSHYHAQMSKTVILYYDLSGSIETDFQNLNSAFSELIECKRSWHIEASGDITDLNEWKRQAGAGKLVKRQSVKLSLNSPPFVSTNIETLSIPVGKQTLYFFPDRILAYESGKVGAVAYKDLQMEVDNSRFIESSSVPSDATVVDKTWQYVNKSGGPDKRYKNNRQLPIALYSELYFTSPSGLNELIQVSQPNKGNSFIEAISQLVEEQLNTSIQNTESADNE